MNVENEVKELRRWQRHWLLRQYGDNGQVLPENIKLSEALDAVLTELASMDRRAVIEAWFPMETLVHQHVSDSPLTVDGKVVPATYTSDPVILTNGKRVWVERSVIMGGAMSSSANKFTAYPSGDKPTHWQPLPAPPAAPEAGR